MGFIAAAVGSTVVKEWRKGGRLYERMLKIVAAATDGSNRVKAVLYYQGENDITHYHPLSALGDYRAYKSDLKAAIRDFHDDLGVPVLVGQITNLLSDRMKNDNIRKAQQELWSELPFALPGAVTYDIRPSDGVHYRDEANLRAFAGRLDFGDPCGKLMEDSRDSRVPSMRLLLQDGRLLVRRQSSKTGVRG